MNIGAIRPELLLALVAISFLPASSSAQNRLPQQPAPDVEILPPPRSVEPGDVGVGPGDWVDPQGSRWKFDGLRWRVLWENNQWFPVIPPGPLPCWRKEDFGKGWVGVLPPNSSTWHLVPPSLAFMPVPLPPSGPPASPPPTIRNWRCFKRWQAH